MRDMGMFNPILRAYLDQAIKARTLDLEHVTTCCHRNNFLASGIALEEVSTYVDKIRAHFKNHISVEVKNQGDAVNKVYHGAVDKVIPQLKAVQDEEPNPEKLKMLKPGKSGITFEALQQGLQDQNKLLSFVKSLIACEISTTDEELTTFHEKIDSFKCPSFGIFESAGYPALHYTYTKTSGRPYVQMGYPTNFIKLFVEATDVTTKVVDTFTRDMQTSVEQMIQRGLVALTHVEDDHSAKIIAQHVTSVAHIWSKAIQFSWWAYWDHGAVVAMKFHSACKSTEKAEEEEEA